MKDAENRLSFGLRLSCRVRERWSRFARLWRWSPFPIVTARPSGERTQKPLRHRMKGSAGIDLRTWPSLPQPISLYACDFDPVVGLWERQSLRVL